MTYRFICSGCADKVASNPQFGLEHWENCMQLGVACFEKGQFKQAVEYIGASYEVASIGIHGEEPVAEGDLSNFDRFALSGHGLAECYRHVGNRKLELHYLLATHYELMGSFRAIGSYSARLHKLVEISLSMLKRHYDRDQQSASVPPPRYTHDLACWQSRNRPTVH